MIPGGGRLERDRIQALAQGRPWRRRPAAARRRVPHRPPRGGQGRKGHQGRLRSPHRRPARLLPPLADQYRPHREPRGARRPRLHLPHRRVLRRRQEPRRLPSRAARGRRAREGPPGGPARHRARGGAFRPGRLRARVRCFRQSRRGSAGLLHISEMGWSRVGFTGGDRPGGRGHHRQGAPGRKRQDRAGLEAAPDRPLDSGRRRLRSRPGAPEAA